MYWLADDRLVPESAKGRCAVSPDILVAQLLDELAAGPSDDARASGMSSAVPPDSGLELVSFEGGTVTVDIEPETSLSAELLPVAVGQVVLTVASAPSVRSVRLVSDGEPVQVPLPEGILTDGPVDEADYADLLPGRYPRSRGLGCRES